MPIAVARVLDNKYEHTCPKARKPKKLKTPIFICLRAILTKGRHFWLGKNIADFELLTLELLKLHHQSLKLKFLKYGAQVTTDFEPIFAQSLCPKINVTFVMVV